MQIKFKNGESLEYENALETEEYYQGSSRRTLTFTCLPDAMGVDRLNAILSDETNTEEIELTADMGEETVRNIYTGYVLKLSVGIEQVLQSGETPDSPARYEDRLVFKLGMRTYIEQALKNLGL